MSRRWVAAAAAALVVLAGCGDGGTSPGTATATSTRITTSATRTLGTPSDAPGTQTSQPTSEAADATSETSTSPSTSAAAPDSWTADISAAPVPEGFRAASPNGEVYAAEIDGMLCLIDWSGSELGCPVEIGSASLYPVFAPEGSYLAAVLTDAGQSTVWLVDTASGDSVVVTPDGLSAEPTDAMTFNISAATWNRAEDRFFVLQFPADGAASGELLAVRPDGSPPLRASVPADIAASSPQLAVADEGILIAPNTGPATGQLWWLNNDVEVTQVGSGTYSDGTVILVSVSPLGDYAMICPANGADVGELHGVDLAGGGVQDYLTDDGCHGSVYSPDARYVAVVGPVGPHTVLTIFDDDSSEVLLSETLNDNPTTVPPTLTWSSANVLTVTPADLTAPTAEIAVVDITAG